MAPDPTFAFVGGPSCPTLDLVIAFWIMIYVLHIVNFAILYLKNLDSDDCFKIESIKTHIIHTLYTNSL